MKRKQTEDSEDEEADYNEVKKVKSEESSKSQNSQNFVKNFRLKLKQGDFYDDLKQFLKHTEKSNKYLDLYIKSGGKVLEVVEAIKSNEESNLEVCSSLYKLLRLVIFEIIKSKDENLSPTIQALHYLINRNKNTINNMLKSSNPEDKILVLKVLSISISLESDLGQEILKSVEIFTSANEKEDYSLLTDTSKKSIYEDSLRLAFVHFFLAFLIDDNNVLIRKRILRKPKLFEMFMQNLQHDSLDVIKIVFTTLTKNILISPAFSKPDKLKIFTENSVKSILKLYEWSGPKNSILGEPSAEDKKTVVGIAHEFLLLLLTSKKHGIVFKALSENRQNSRQSQVISYFKKFWLLEDQAELVIEIVKACPELMQNILNGIVFALKPNAKKDWFLCANFTKHLIMALEPSHMIEHIKKLEPKKISANIIKFSISQFILQNLDTNALISLPNLAIRENSVNLLWVMLDQCCKFLQEVKKLDNLKHFEAHRIKFDIINHIFTFYPNLDLILNSLYRSINQVKKSEDPDEKNAVKNQLKYTLEILLLIIKYFPSIIDKTPSIIEYLEFLRPIYEFNVEDDDMDQNDNFEIEMKVVKIILYLEPSILSVESERFSKIFQTFIRIYCFSSNKNYRNEAKFLMNVILSNLEVFPGKNSMEIDLWIEAFRFVNINEIGNVVGVFVKNLREFKEQNLLEEVEENGSLDDDILQEIEDASEEDLEVSYCGDSLVFKKFLLTQPTKKLKKILDYIEVISLFLYQFSPADNKKILDVLENPKIIELNPQTLSYFKKQSKNPQKLIDLSDYFTRSESFLYGKLGDLIQGESEDFESFLKSVESEEELMILGVQLIFYTKILIKSETDEIDKISEFLELIYRKLILLESEKVSRKLDFVEDVLENNTHKIQDLESLKMSEKLLNYIFKENSYFLENFEVKKENLSTKFVCRLMGIFKEHPLFSEATKKYRGKLVTSVKNLVRSKKLKNSERILNLLGNFVLNSQNCLEIFDVLLEVPQKDDSGVVVLVDFFLRRLKELKTSPLNADQVEKLEEFYLRILKNGSASLTDLEINLLEYLLVFPHNIGDFSKEIFEICFDESDELKVKVTTKSFVKLASLLFERNSKFNEIFLMQLKSKNPIHKDRKELFYPLLNVAFGKKIFDESSQENLKFIYQEYKNGIIKAIEKPNKAAQIYRENLESSLKIIEICMPINECQDLSLKKYKFEHTEVFQLKMLEKIVRKTLENCKKPEIFGQICINFINNWIQMFGIMIGKKSRFDLEYLEVLENFCDKYKDLKLEEPLVLEDLSEQEWEIFYRNCLKYGLKFRETGDYSRLLILLGKFINILVPDRSQNEEIPKIFDMIITHSNFFNVTFSFKNLEMKKNLYYLLNVLVLKNETVASEKHIPIFLSSYHGTMAKTDQLILNLIRVYELKCDIDLNEFKPMLFGSTALNFYSDEYKEFSGAKKSVDNMAVSVSNLMNSFEKSIVENTVNNFPIKREMKILTIKEIEGILTKKESDDINSSNIYDPAFFLPLFEMIFSTSTWNFSSAVVKNNLLSMIWPALSCEKENFRLLAAHTLMKFKEASEIVKNHVEIFLRFYDAVQIGYGELSETNKTSFPRPSSISTQCLAEFNNILPNKLHDLYPVVSNYLLAMKNFQFFTIPEYVVLFHSSDVKYTEYREFLLNFILHGIKDDLDLKLLNNTPVLKMLFSFYNCPLSDRKLNELILKIVNKLVIKTGKLQFLLKMYGIIPWLYQIVSNLEAFEYDTIDLLIELIKNLYFELKLDSLHTTEEKLHLNQKLLEMLLKILPKFTKSKISVKSFNNFLQTIVEIDRFDKISSVEIAAILDLLEVFVDFKNILDLNYIQKFPNSVKFVEDNQKYLRTLENLNLGKDLVDVSMNCRTILIKFYKKSLKN